MELGSNHGYTRAVNRGVSAGEGEYVVLLNNDVRLRPTAWSDWWRRWRGDPRLGSVAAMMLRPGERTIDSVGVTADVTLAGFARLQGQPTADATSGAHAGADRPRGHRRRLPPRGLGAGGRAGRDDHRLHGDPRPRAATAHRRMGTRRARRTRAACTWARAPTANARPAQRRLAGFSRGYLLRRYGVLRGRAGARALLTEAAVVARGHGVLPRHAGAARPCRRVGARARACPATRDRRSDAIDPSISLWESLTARGAARDSASDDQEAGPRAPGAAHDTRHSARPKRRARAAGAAAGRRAAQSSVRRSATSRFSCSPLR